MYVHLFGNGGLSAMAETPTYVNLLPCGAYVLSTHVGMSKTYRGLIQSKVEWFFCQFRHGFKASVEACATALRDMHGSIYV